MAHTQVPSSHPNDSQGRRSVSQALSQEFTAISSSDSHKPQLATLTVFHTRRSRLSDRLPEATGLAGHEPSPKLSSRTGVL